MRLSAKYNFISELLETFRDLRGAFERWPLIINLASQDILARYRGSVIGPWWITLVTLSLVLGIGTTYASSFHTQVAVLMPYVAVGVVTWSFLSAAISDGGEAFISAAALLRQTALPLPVFIFRSLVRNLVNLGHQLVIIIGVLTWFRIFPGIAILWSLAGLASIIFNVSWITMVIALISARFRDVPQIVSALLQFLFFLTPIFWLPSAVQLEAPAIKYNPFFLAIQSVRAPLLQGISPVRELAYLTAFGIIGWTIAILCYTQSRRRVVHFL
ncbi:MAG TPA: ABC transporter permease [Oculatellaceae cyanobacterium]